MSLPALLSLTLAAAWSDEVERTPRELQADAALIVTGVVQAVYSREVTTTLYGAGTLETHYLLEISVRDVEKGREAEKGDLVYARCWMLKQYGAKGRLVGPGGFDRIPREGEKVRAYLTRRGYNPTGQAVTGWFAVSPNGFQKLPFP